MGGKTTAVASLVVFVFIFLLFFWQLQPSELAQKDGTKKQQSGSSETVRSDAQSTDLSDSYDSTKPESPTSSELNTDNVSDNLPPIVFEGKTREEIVAQIRERRRALAESQGKLAEFEEKERERTLKKEKRELIRKDHQDRKKEIDAAYREERRRFNEARKNGEESGDITRIMEKYREERRLTREDAKRSLNEANGLN